MDGRRPVSPREGARQNVCRSGNDGRKARLERRDDGTLLFLAAPVRTNKLDARAFFVIPCLFCVREELEEDWDLEEEKREGHQAIQRLHQLVALPFW